jgi:hypothetical protein
MEAEAVKQDKGSLCRCGCGERKTKRKRHFLPGHNRQPQRGKKAVKDTDRA